MTLATGATLGSGRTGIRLPGRGETAGGENRRPVD